MIRITLVVALLAALPAHSEIVSIGDWSCTTWIERRQSGGQADAPQMWLAGFMTALATAAQVDVLAITDAPALFTWMDKFCARLPAKNISAGGLLLFEDLRRRMPTSAPRLSQR